MATVGFKLEEKLSGSANFNSWKARLTAILDENDLDDIVLNVTNFLKNFLSHLIYEMSY